MYCLYKGDTAPNLIKINFDNQEQLEIKTLIVQCGKVKKKYENPTFPFYVSYTADETLQFDTVNTVYAGIITSSPSGETDYRTFNGSVTFRACPKVVEYE